MNSFDYLFGASNFFAGTCLFLIAFKIYKPKYKTEEQAVRSDGFFKKFGVFFKIISIVLIVRGVCLLLS